MAVKVENIKTCNLQMEIPVQIQGCTPGKLTVTRPRRHVSLSPSLLLTVGRAPVEELSLGLLSREAEWNGTVCIHHQGSLPKCSLWW